MTVTPPISVVAECRQYVLAITECERPTALINIASELTCTGNNRSPEMSRLSHYIVGWHNTHKVCMKCAL